MTDATDNLDTKNAAPRYRWRPVLIVLIADLAARGLVRPASCRQRLGSVLGLR